MDNILYNSLLHEQLCCHHLFSGNLYLNKVCIYKTCRYLQVINNMLKRESLRNWT